jgi:hypothetical protein
MAEHLVSIFDICGAYGRKAQGEFGGVTVENNHQAIGKPQVRLTCFSKAKAE